MCAATTGIGAIVNAVRSAGAAGPAADGCRPRLARLRFLISGYPDDVDYRGAFRDFAHFIAAFEVRMNALRTYDDFRRVVVEYAGEAAAQGAVYIEAIFS